MRKSINKFVLIIIVALFMTSCFSTRQSCGVAQTQKNIKNENSKTLYSEVIVLKKQAFVLADNAK